MNLPIVRPRTAWPMLTNITSASAVTLFCRVKIRCGRDLDQCSHFAGKLVWA